MKNSITSLTGLNAHSPGHLFHDVAKNIPLKTYQREDFLFMERDPCRSIMFIDKGKVKVGQYNEKGNEQVIAFLGKGELIGQMALFGETCHRVFAEVVENDTRICKINVAEARELIRNNAPFAQEMNQHISIHIKRLERRIEILLYKNIKKRLVEFFKDLAKNHGRPRDGGIWIPHNLTQSDIAALIGTSRKSASLTMNALENDGLIEFDRKHIYIFNRQQFDAAGSRQVRARA